MSHHEQSNACNDYHREKYNKLKDSDRICVLCVEKIPTSFIRRADKVCNDCHYKRTHPDGMKVCNTCAETKEMSLFAKQRNMCQACRTQKDGERYQKFKAEEGTRTCSVCNEVKDC